MTSHPHRIGRKTYEILNEIQSEYLRMIYSCPPTTPKPALRSQTGIVNSKHHIWVEKVCIVGEQEENYAREVLKEQIEQGW